MFGRKKDDAERFIMLRVAALTGPLGRFESIELGGPPDVVGAMLRQAIIGVGGTAEPVAELLQMELDLATEGGADDGR
jgi:hypothetical protein